MWANVVEICRSSSLRSVTTTTFGLQGANSIKRYFTSITMVKLFAAALGVPDYTALAIPSFIRFLDGLTNLFDGKILLVTANLLHIGVKED